MDTGRSKYTFFCDGSHVGFIGLCIPGLDALFLSGCFFSVSELVGYLLHCKDREEMEPAFPGLPLGTLARGISGLWFIVSNLKLAETI